MNDRVHSRIGTAGDRPLAMSRRDLLLGAAGTVAWLTACSDDNEQAGAVLAFGDQAPKVASWSDLAILAAGVDVVVGVEAESPTIYAYRADAEMTSFGPETRAQRLTILRYVEFYAALNSDEGQPFSRLSPEGKGRWLEHLRTSSDPSSRAVYHVYRQFLVTAYYSDSRVWSDIGYPGPPAVGEVLDDSLAGASS